MNRPRTKIDYVRTTHSFDPLDPDLPRVEHPRHLDRQQVMEAGLAEPERDTVRNQWLARQNGWSEEQFDHWCETGEAPE